MTVTCPSFVFVNYISNSESNMTSTWPLKVHIERKVQKGNKTTESNIIGTTFIQYAIHHPIRTVHEKSAKVVS